MMVWRVVKPFTQSELKIVCGPNLNCLKHPQMFCTCKHWVVPRGIQANNKSRHRPQLTHYRIECTDPALHTSQNYLESQS